MREKSYEKWAEYLVEPSKYSVRGNDIGCGAFLGPKVLGTPEGACPCQPDICLIGKHPFLEQAYVGSIPMYH